MLKEQTKRRAYDLGFTAYLDDNIDNPFSRPWATHTPEPRLSKMDDLSWEWSQGYDAAERAARVELRHARSLRYPGV